MKLTIYFRANESAKSAGSVNKDITQEAYRIGTHTKSDILRAVWLSVNNSGVTNEDRIKILCDSSARAFTWNSSWVFIGEKPASIAASKTALLSMTCFGTSESDVVCSYAVKD